MKGICGRVRFTKVNASPAVVRQTLELLNVDLMELFSTSTAALSSRSHTLGRIMQRAFLRQIPAIAFLLASGTVTSFSGTATAQQPPAAKHFLLNSDLPPGTIGQFRLAQQQPYYQPVRIQVPAGAEVALAANGAFMPTSNQPVTAGLLVGGVYRLQVTNIPNQPGVELFPTVEVLDRVYPPQGQATNFPIPIHIDADDLALALEGRLVTRVVYLEDPHAALPLADAPNTQRSFDIRADLDPIHEADRLGRPVAVLRIGSRVPPSEPQLLDQFLLGCAPWLDIPSVTPTQP